MSVSFPEGQGSLSHLSCFVRRASGNPR